MAWAVTKYGYINAKLRAQLSKRIQPEQFQQMVQASNITETLQILQKTEYEEAFSIYHETGDIKMVEKELIRHEIEAFQRIRSYLADDVLGIIESFLERYEVDTVKDSIRYWFDRLVRNRNVDDHTIYMNDDRIVHEINYSAIVYAANAEEIQEELAATPYGKAVTEELSNAVESGSLFALECALENIYYTRLSEKIDRLSGKDRDIARSIIGIQIDMENITRLSRVMRFFKDTEKCEGQLFISGGKNINSEELHRVSKSDSPLESVSTIIRTYYAVPGMFDGKEKAREDTFFVMLLSVLQEIFTTEVMKLLPGYPFTIGIVLAFCFIKQNEMKKIRALLNAKYYKVDESRMQEIV